MMWTPDQGQIIMVQFTPSSFSVSYFIKPKWKPSYGIWYKHHSNWLYYNAFLPPHSSSRPAWCPPSSPRGLRSHSRQLSRALAGTNALSSSSSCGPSSSCSPPGWDQHWVWEDRTIWGPYHLRSTLYDSWHNQAIMSLISDCVQQLDMAVVCVTLYPIQFYFMITLYIGLCSIFVNNNCKHLSGGVPQRQECRHYSERILEWPIIIDHYALEQTWKQTTKPVEPVWAHPGSALGRPRWCPWKVSGGPCPCWNSQCPPSGSAPKHSDTAAWHSAPACSPRTSPQPSCPPWHRSASVGSTQSNGYTHQDISISVFTYKNIHICSGIQSDQRARTYHVNLFHSQKYFIKNNSAHFHL